MSRGHFVGAGYHRRLLADSERVDAFEAAIRELVQPGMCVADIGTGTGLLALIASAAGARRVYAIDPAPVIRTAREVAWHNGVDNIEFHETDSRHLTLPEPVDLVVSECLGNFVVTDEMLDVLADARRHLKPGGTICPARISLYLAPVQLPAFREIDFWRDVPVAGFDFAPMRVPALRKAYVTQVYADDVLGTASLFHVIDPLTMEFSRTLAGNVEMELTKRGPLSGIAGWFDAELSPSVTLSTRPGVRTHWGQLVFPVDGLQAEPGDRIELSLSLFVDPDAERSSWHWQATLLRGSEVLGEFEARTDDPWGPPLSAKVEDDARR